MHIINVKLISTPHSIAATTAVIDLEILVNSKNEVTIDRQSVKNGFFNRKPLTFAGKWKKENTNDRYVMAPKIMPSCIQHASVEAVE
ncbi:MAG: hypothetical protein H8E74_11610 [Gammaproteobacteria bacterium]|nr:hypothetical protein [Gammaproteobacteria bacterium]